MTDTGKKKIGRDDIGVKFHEKRGVDGLFAAFDKQQRLVELSYIEGAAQKVTLAIEYEKRNATLTRHGVKLFAEADYEDSDDSEDHFIEFIEDAILQVTRYLPERRQYCCFCQKHQSEVKKLIAGPTHYICDECVMLCAEIVREETSRG